MGQAYESPQLAAVYEAGNQMPPSSLRAWADYIVSFAPRAPADVVEIGSGTGMLSVALARSEQVASVVGVEPSEPMRAQALRLNPDPRVTYLAGEAASVPTGADEFDLALISRVIHHVPDRRACAREVARILRGTGVVVIRTTVRERLDSLVYHYWPKTRLADAERFPSQDEITADFAHAGFTIAAITSFAQPVTGSLREYHARLATRPQSKLTALTDAEFDEGLRRLEADASAEDSTQQPQPVSERYDVIVLVRTSSSLRVRSERSGSNGHLARP